MYGKIQLDINYRINYFCIRNIHTALKKQVINLNLIPPKEGG